MVVPACNPSHGETEAEGQKLKASLSYMLRPTSKEQGLEM
jgi:hypothetical protein